MAGRIPQSFINELLARVDLVEVIDRRVPLKKAGRNYSACCPFHNEKTPSFSVNPDKQFYYCFGCGVSGNALTFLMEYEGQEFVAAIEDLAAQNGMEVPRETTGADPHFAQNQRLYELMEKVAVCYQQALKSHPQAKKAIEYLKNRGLSGEIAKQYGMGFAPADWQNLLHLGKDQKTLIDDLDTTGMMIKKDDGRAYDRFRDRIMFPIRNRRGQVLGFGGRVIDKGEPKYLNSPETPLFHKGRELYGIYEMRKQLRNIEQIVIVEGYMDVVALAQFGIPNSVATLGTATTSDHLHTLFRICPNIVFCFDGDKAGRKAALRALTHALPLLKNTREVRLMFLADGEDPDSTVRKIGKDAFLEQMANAITLFDYLIEHLTRQVDMNTFEGPAKLVHLAKPFISEIKEPILLTRFRQKIGQLAGLSEQQLAEIIDAEQDSTEQRISNQSVQRSPQPSNYDNQSIEPSFSQDIHQPVENKEEIKQDSRNKTLFRRAIALLLQHPDALPPAELNWLSAFDEGGAAILWRLVQVINDNDSVTTGVLVEQFRDEEAYAHLIKLANIDLHAHVENIQAELCEIFKRLEKNCLLDEIDRLVDKVRQRTATPDEKAALSQLLAARKEFE